MAGLLDFGSYGDLLDERAQKMAAARAMATMAGGLLSASGPSLVPQGTGAAIGQSITPALQAYDASAQGAIRNNLIRRQIADQETARRTAAAQALARKRAANAMLYGSGQAGGRAMMMGGPQAPVDRRAVAGNLIDAGETKAGLDYLTATPPKPTTVEIGVGNGMKQRAILGPDNKPIPIGDPYPAFAPPKPDLTLVEVADPTSPTGTRMVPRADAANQPGPPARGMNLTIGPDGEVQFSTGGTGQMTRRTTGNIEAEIETMRDNYANLGFVKDSYDPKYQTVAGRLGTAWTSLRSKWGGVIPGVDGADITPEERETLVEFASYRRNAISGLNEYIQSITGAAMSNAEAKRITAAFPKVGEGIFDGDDPTTFQAKLNESMAQIELALARKTYSYRNGVDWKGITLPRMRVIMRNERDKIIRDLRRENPDATDEEIDTQGRLRFKQTFGI